MTGMCVGGRYRNRNGWYEVLSVSGKDCKVRFETDNTIHTLNLDILNRIRMNIEAEEYQVIPYSEKSSNECYFYSIGILANHGKIEAFVPVKCQKGFCDTYIEMTGMSPEESACFFLMEDSDRWGSELRLILPEGHDMNLGVKYPIVNGSFGKSNCINSNSLCWSLFELGFRIGATHDIEKIQSNIPDHYKDYFIEGVCHASS